MQMSVKIHFFKNCYGMCKHLFITSNARYSNFISKRILKVHIFLPDGYNKYLQMTTQGYEYKRCAVPKNISKAHLKTLCKYCYRWRNIGLLFWTSKNNWKQNMANLTQGKACKCKITIITKIFFFVYYSHLMYTATVQIPLPIGKRVISSVLLRCCTKQKAHGATSLSWASMALYGCSREIVTYGPSVEKQKKIP